jgi:hypothetical protein
LAARDFIVVGCDSLATTTRPLLAPNLIEQEFFDAAGKLKVDSSGIPLLREPNQLWKMSKHYPVDQLPSVTKAYALGEKAALLFAGASRVGSVTVKNLVGSFLDSFLEGSTMEKVADDLKTFVADIYEKEILKAESRPSMEIILSGYSPSSRNPQAFRLSFSYNWNTEKFVSEVIEEVKSGKFKVIFGGQYDVIQRVVTGVDLSTFLNLQTRGWAMLRAYRSEIETALKAGGFTGAVPDIVEGEDRYDVFGGQLIGVSRMHFDEGSLSEQAGIDFVAFLLNTMIKAQEFSSSIPTVGGDVHIGMLSADHGLKWISPEQYRFQGHLTPKSK